MRSKQYSAGWKAGIIALAKLFQEHESNGSMYGYIMDDALEGKLHGKDELGRDEK